MNKDYLGFELGFGCFTSNNEHTFSHHVHILSYHV